MHMLLHAQLQSMTAPYVHNMHVVELFEIAFYKRKMGVCCAHACMVRVSFFMTDVTRACHAGHPARGKHRLVNSNPQLGLPPGTVSHIILTFGTKVAGTKSYELQPILKARVLLYGTPPPSVKNYNGMKKPFCLPTSLAVVIVCIFCTYGITLIAGDTHSLESTDRTDSLAVRPQQSDLLRVSM